MTNAKAQRTPLASLSLKFVKEINQKKFSFDDDQVLDCNFVMDLLDELTILKTHRLVAKRRYMGLGGNYEVLAISGETDCESIPIPVRGAPSDYVPEKYLLMRSFSEASVWQLWLFTHINNWLPIFWHHNYSKMNMFFEKNSWERFLRNRDIPDSVAEDLRENYSFEPVVNLLDNESATVEYLYCNHEGSLFKVKEQVWITHTDEPLNHYFGPSKIGREFHLCPWLHSILDHSPTCWRTLSHEMIYESPVHIFF